MGELEKTTCTTPVLCRFLSGGRGLPAFLKNSLAGTKHWGGHSDSCHSPRWPERTAFAVRLPNAENSRPECAPWDKLGISGGGRLFELECGQAHFQTQVKMTKSKFPGPLTLGARDHVRLADALLL